MTSVRPSHYRIWLLVSPRDDQFAHPKELYHWNVVVENAKSGMWKECHASECDPCGKGGVNELFEDTPAVYGRPPIRDFKFCVEVARFNPAKLSEIMQMLENIPVCDFKPGATCRLYARKVLKNLKDDQGKFGVVSLTSFKDACEGLQGKVGPLEKVQKMPRRTSVRPVVRPAIKSRPSRERTAQYKVSTGLGGRSKPDKEKTTAPKSSSKAKSSSKTDQGQNPPTKPNTRSSTKKKLDDINRPPIQLDNIKTRVPAPRRASDGQPTTRVMSFVSLGFITKRKSAP